MLVVEAVAIVLRLATIPIDLFIKPADASIHIICIIILVVLFVLRTLVPVGYII